MLVVTFLLVLAVQGPWWAIDLTSVSDNSNTLVQAVTVTYYAGGAVSCSVFNKLYTANFTPCANVSGHQSGVHEAVYEGLNDAVLGLVGVSALASLFAVLGVFEIKFGRRQLTTEIALLIAVTVAAVVIAAVPVVAGPGGQASGYCSTLSGNTTGCTTFWGSASAAPGVLPGSCLLCINTVSWGAAFGFYDSLVAAAVAGAIAAFLWIGRKKPYTAQEVDAWMVRHRPVPIAPDEEEASAPGSAAASSSAVVWERPPTDATHPGFRIAQHAWTCPRCHAVNSRWALLCRVCRADRPPA